MSKPSFVQRFFLAFAAYFRILFDADFAARVLTAQQSTASFSPDRSLDSEIDDAKAGTDGAEANGTKASMTEVEPQATRTTGADGALQLLSLLQRHGRFVDFVQQDVNGFSDADIGQAARVVHDGCRTTLNKYLKLEAVLDSEEGATTTVAAGFDARAIKLTGNVSGDAPYRGVLRHRGWRASSIELPETQAGHSFEVLAPAEVEV